MDLNKIETSRIVDENNIENELINPNQDLVIGKIQKNTTLAENNSLIMKSTKKNKTPSTKYGWSRSTTLNSLQFMSNKNAFLIIFSITCVLQGTFHTYFVAVITTLEKLFSIPSKTTGTLMAATEIGQVSSALLLPYFASSGHRPRWMGLGAALFSIATLLTASPHWLLPPNLKPITEDSISYCLSNNSSDNCNLNNETSPGHYLLFAIFATSLLSIGLGQTAVYTLGIPYLDDNVASRDSPLYFSITIGVRIMGPVLGFILGSLCTRLYIYPSINPGFGPESPRWLGAWWLGMLLISILLFAISLILSAFPRKLPTKTNMTSLDKIHEPIMMTSSLVGGNEGNLVVVHNENTVTSSSDKRVSRDNMVVMTSEQDQMTSSSKDQLKTTSSPTTNSTLRNFPLTIRRLITNKLLLLRTASSVFHLLPISGLYTFLPKYLESQFRLPAHDANMITGIAGILVMGAGIFGSGIWIRIKSPSAKGVAGWVALTAGLYSIGMFLLIFIGCESDADFFNSGGINITSNYYHNKWDFGKPACITETNCTTCSQTDFSPICGLENSKIYFSPCHAGCNGVNKTSNNTIIQYHGCSCIPSTLATPGLCPSKCKSTQLYLYLSLFMLIVLLHSTSEVGSMLLTLRCVERNDKAMALGLIQCAIGLFGNVPCPILYGAIVDRACLLWSSTNSSCDNNQNNKGNCWIYNSFEFRTFFHGTTGSLMLIAFTIDLIFYFHANQVILDEEQTTNTENNKQKETSSHELIPLNNIEK